MWQRVEKFSIRKFSFGAASCLIGAITVLGSSSQIANADGITSYEANGDKVTAYAHGESVYKLRGTSTSIYNAFRMNVDTSKYTKENPVVTVTLTYNAPDNPNEKAPIFWSGRPFHWFTVPEGTEELGNDYGFTLTNGSGDTNKYTNWSSWESNSRFIHSKYNGNPDAWERHNTTTGETLRKTPFVSLNSEFNKFLGDYNNRWYDNSNMPTQEIMHDLRAKSRSIYADWEKRAAGTVTVTYTTKVKDPVNTKELTIGMGVYQELNRQQYARVETVKLPVLYKLNEVFEPKVPERTGVVDKTKLTDAEVNDIKEKIWTANGNNESELLSTNKSFKDNLKNGKDSITIDKATGNATITYKDGSTDTIEGSKLIYEKPKASKDDTASTDLKTDGYWNIKYYIKPVTVERYENITPDDKSNALDSFLRTNLTEEGWKHYNSHKEVRKQDLKSGVSFNLDRYPARFEFNEKDELKIIRKVRERPLGTVPKEYLFKQKQEPAFDVKAARTEAKKVIGSLDNLYPSEKTDFETKINQATNREGIEKVLNDAQSKANENAVELAKMKKAANDKINALGYLTKDEKEAAIAKINTATIKQSDTTVDKVFDDKHPDKDVDRGATKARLDSLVDTLVKKDLEAARKKAIETIKGIPTENLSEAKKNDYITQINKADKLGPVSEEGTILNIVEKAQKEASDAEATRKKEEADKVRQQYKDMIANIPDLTETEKDEYKKEIDKASNIDEMDAIVEFAKLAGERKKAAAAIEKLEHLNNNQKQSFKDRVENSANKEEIENYVSQAKQLNSKMKQLHDLAEKAKTIKSTDKYTSAADDKKTAFNKALGNAESVLDKANGADEAITSVEKLFKALETAINELKPGSEKVKVDVDKSLLQEEYAKGETVKKSPAYTKEKDEAKKQAYDNALRKAKEILDKSDASQDEVDKALEALESAKADLHGKQEEFALSKKDEKPVPISVEPVVGDINLSSEDKKLVQDKINGIPTGAIVVYKPIVEKDNKKYVPVKVTHENVSKEIEIEVVQSEAAKITPTVSTAKLSEVPTENGTITKAEDVQKVTEAVSVPVPEGQAQPRKDLVDNGKVVQGTDQRANGGANNTGKLVVKVEVTYQDGSKETVEVPVEGTDAAKSPLTPPTKVKVNNPNSLTEEEKTAVKEAVKKTNPTLNDKDISVDEKGKVTVTYPDTSTNTLEADKTVEAKTELDKAKEKAKSDLIDAANKEKSEIDADTKLSKDEKDKAKAKVDEVKKAAEDKIGKATTPEDVTKATDEGKKAIDEVHQTELDKAKEKAKSDLTDAANKEKSEIDADTKLSKDEKDKAKAKVDEVKKAAEDKIGKATTPEDVTKATDEGKKAIADVYKPQTAKGQSTNVFKPGLDLQTALVSGKATVEKGKDLTDEEILKQLALADGVTAKVISKPTTTEKGTKEAEVEVTLANGTKITVKVPIEVVDSLGTADKDNDLAEAKEDAKKQVEDAAKKKLDEIKKDTGLTEEQKQKAEEAINKAEDEAKKAIDQASSAGTAKQIADQAKENIEKYYPKADAEVKKPDVTNLDEEKAKAKAEILEEAQKRIDEIKNNKDLSDEAKQKAIEEINKAKDKAIEDINKGQSKDEINAAKEAGIHKINEVQPDGSIASKFEPKVPENKVEVGNPAKLSDEEREQVRQNIEGANTFPDGTTVEVQPDGTAVITYKDGSSDTISKDKLVEPANKETETIASRTEPVIPGKTQVGNTTKLTPEEQATVKKAVEEANNFPAGTTVEVRPDGTVVITYPDKSVDTITGDKLVEKGSKQETPKVQTDAEKNPAHVPGNFVPVENTHNLTQAEQDTVAAKVKEANPAATDVKVSKDGTATLTYGDGSVNTIPGNQLVAQDPKAQDSTKPTAEKSTVKAPVQRVDVKDITHLTDEEKEKVKVAILQANGSALDGATITVAGDGTATITFPDGLVVTILGKDTVQQSAKGESVTQEATPEYKPETTPGGDNGGNTGSSDANANAGGGSQAGGQANTGSQNPAQSQASKQLATEKESAKKAIEKAAKDKQDEIKGAPLSDKEKAEFLARVEAEKQAALKEIENAKTVEDVKEAETIGVQAIAMVTVPKRPVAPNAAPQATSAPQATAGTMQDVTYQSPAGKQLPNTGSASSAALASLGLVATTSGFALLGRKARRRK